MPSTSEGNTPSSLYTVPEKAREECGFPGGRFCLWRVLKGMGVTYKKRDNKNTYTNTQTYWNKDTHIVDYTQTETRTCKPCIHRRDMGEHTSQQRIHMG